MAAAFVPFTPVCGRWPYLGLTLSLPRNTLWWVRGPSWHTVTLPAAAHMCRFCPGKWGRSSTQWKWICDHSALTLRTFLHISCTSWGSFRLRGHFSKRVKCMFTQVHTEYLGDVLTDLIVSVVIVVDSFSVLFHFFSLLRCVLWWSRNLSHKHSVPFN